MKRIVFIAGGPAVFARLSELAAASYVQT